MQSYGKKTILNITITNLTQYRLDLEQRTTISQLIWGPKIEKTTNGQEFNQIPECW